MLYEVKSDPNGKKMNRNEVRGGASAVPEVQEPHRAMVVHDIRTVFFREISAPPITKYLSMLRFQ